MSLKGGLYVYFDKVVLDTLPIFKEIKKKDAKTREEFVKNPKRLNVNFWYGRPEKENDCNRSSE